MAAHEAWPMVRLKSCFSNVVDQASASENGNRGLALECVESWTGDVGDAVPLDGVVKRFRQGDVLFGKLRPYLAKVARPDHDGVCVGEFLVLRPRESRIDAAFAANLLRSKPMVDAANALAVGARMPRAEWDSIGSMRISVPRLDEQAAIVRFLDRAGGRIQRAICAKQHLIGLLNEEKRALIHRAVTRGVDPTVHLGPSGLAWLGEMPKHWRLARLRGLVTEAVAGPYGSSLTKSMYTSEGFRVYGQQQVIAGDFSIGDYYISPEKYREMLSYRVVPNDVLVTVMGTIGRVAVVPKTAEPGIINPRLVRYRPDSEQVRPDYLQIAMSSYLSQSQLEEAAKGTTMDGLNMRILGDLVLLVPPLREQDAIFEKVTAEAERLNCALSNTVQEIGLLHEYRTRLITDAVTGKLDVRTADPEPAVA